MDQPTPAAETAALLPTDAATLAKLFAQMRTEMQAQFQSQLAEAIAALRPELIQAIAIDVNAAFEARNPGIGGAPPSPSDILPELEAAGEHLTVGLLHAFVTKVSDKLDALVQATGHGNSASMVAHL